jgi:uncharacterized membrane protein
VGRLFTTVAAHKYKIAIFGLLSLASAICIALVLARVAYSDSRRYASLIWNLMLAWIPFVLAYLAYVFSWRKPLVYAAIPLFAFLWLIFFPNAPYILTDLQHLNQGVANVPVWYDVILLIWFSWTGMLLGVVSLNLMQEIMRRQLGRGTSWVFVFAVAILSGIGMYVGRFIRLNSWDILRNPAEMASSVFDWLMDPSLRSVGFVSLYTLFFVFVYLTMHTFGRILEEGSDRT